MFENVHIPQSYWLAAILLVVAMAGGLFSARRTWAPAYFAVLGTVFAWYFIEPFYTPELFEEFSQNVTEQGFFSVSIFLIVFMFSTQPMVAIFRPRGALAKPSAGRSLTLTADRTLVYVVVLWLILLLYGIARVKWDVIGAMFPFGSRSGAGVAMWGRAGGADAGPEGFIVSSAGYLYQLCLTAFGLLLPITRKPRTRAIIISLMFVSWPYAFLQGSRNIALAIVVPLFASYMLYGRIHIVRRLLICAIGFYCIDWALLIVINFRNYGFSNFDIGAIAQTKHQGLNMASELMHITEYLQDGSLKLSYGRDYFDELVNIVPRAIWPDKPLIGIDYAIVRGFGGANSDIGVFATVSTGMIGQGVLNFGPFFGPTAVGMLMGAWVGILNRVRVQGGVPRAALFLVGLGLTFNLGRDITFLVLFPFVFGQVCVWGLERATGRRRALPLQSSPRS